MAKKKSKSEEHGGVGEILVILAVTLAVVGVIYLVTNPPQFLVKRLRAKGPTEKKKSKALDFGLEGLPILLKKVPAGGEKPAPIKSTLVGKMPDLSERGKARLVGQKIGQLLPDFTDMAKARARSPVE